ncbi:unnamed protein product [Cuscuta campestris]|uniref:Uncharacterized protein n=1 Tax=Cuscuta campestris TaxID=132261 RepID=A0A484NPH3_9ASTE|nr:unnamed protein product [Cuscuta campestris]
MDHSGFYGGAEEYCGSNESGWTMYIASPSHDQYDDDDGYDDYDHHHHHDTAVRRVRSVMNCDEEGNDQNGESDDSMASDASSGPVHQQDCDESLERIHGREKLGKSGAEKETVKKHEKEEEEEEEEGIELTSKKNSRVGRGEEDAQRAAAKNSSYGQNRSFLRRKQVNN